MKPLILPKNLTLSPMKLPWLLNPTKTTSITVPLTFRDLLHHQNMKIILKVYLILDTLPSMLMVPRRHHLVEHHYWDWVIKRLCELLDDDQHQLQGQAFAEGKPQPRPEPERQRQHII